MDEILMREEVGSSRDHFLRAMSITGDLVSEDGLSAGKDGRYEVAEGTIETVIVRTWRLRARQASPRSRENPRSDKYGDKVDAPGMLYGPIKPDDAPKAVWGSSGPWIEHSESPEDPTGRDITDAINAQRVAEAKMAGATRRHEETRGRESSVRRSI